MRRALASVATVPAVPAPVIVAVLIAAALAGAITAGSPLIGLGAALLATALVAALARPDAVSLAVVALTFANVPATLVNAQGVPSFVGAAVPLALVIPIAYRVLNGERLIIDRIFVLIFLFVGIEVASALNAVDLDQAFQTLFGTVLEGLITYFLIVNAIRSREVLFKAVRLVVVGAVFLSLVTIAQSLTGTWDQPWGGFASVGADYLRGFVDQPRAGGPVSDPNYFAQLLLLAVPLAVLGFFSSRHSVAWRTTSLVGGLLILWAVSLTLSRGAALALVVVVLAMVVVRVLRGRHLLLLVVGLAALMMALPQYRERVLTIGEVKGAAAAEGESGAADESIRARLGEMYAGALAFADHPILGVGPQNFPQYYQQYAVRTGLSSHERVRFGEGRGEIPVREAHNLFVGLAADLGALGLGMFLLIVATISKALLRARRAALDEELALVCAGLFLAILGYLVAGLFLTFAFERYFWLIVALGAVAARLVSEEARAERRRAVRQQPAGTA